MNGHEPEPAPATFHYHNAYP